MPLTVSQSNTRYYEQFPSGNHQTGDIWSNIPTHGLLPIPTTAALLITPACDLQNRKTDTLVFVPIVPLTVAVKLRFFFRAFSSEMKQSLKGLLPNLESRCDFSDPDFRSLLAEELRPCAAQANKKDELARMTSWLEFCNSCDPPSTVSLPFLKDKKRNEILEKIARNSYSTDIHFFPRERWNTSYPVIHSHSIGLFRYLLTFPVEIFDAAATSTDTTWPHFIKREHGKRWMMFSDSLPVRSLRLQRDVLVDVITRLTSLYNRIGSDDFTDTCITHFVEET